METLSTSFVYIYLVTGERIGRGRSRRRNRHPLELVMGGKWKPGLRGKRFHLMGTRWNIEKLGTRSDIEILGTRWNFDDFWRLCLALEPHARCWPGCCTWCLDRPGKASWSWGPCPRWTASEAGHLGGIAVILSWRCYVMVSGWLKSSKRDNRVHSCKSRKMLACIFFTLP